MKEQIKYDPEDIESLLLHKEYQDLYPEEREFVLKHLENQDEYKSMRAMLLTISSMDDRDEINPQSKTLDSLMEEFVTEEKQGFKWWLNSLFAGIFPSQRAWYRQPGFQLAMAFGVVLVGFIYFQKSTTTYDNIAEAKQENKEQMPQTPATKQKAKRNTTQLENKNDLSEKIQTESSSTPNRDNEVNSTLTNNNKSNHPDNIKKAVATDNFNSAANEDVISMPTMKGLDLSQKTSTDNARNESVVVKDKVKEDDMETLADDSEEKKEAEEGTSSQPVATPTLAETDKMELDNQVGNMARTTSMEAIKTNENNSNGFQQTASKNLAANQDLISLLYTAP